MESSFPPALPRFSGRTDKTILNIALTELLLYDPVQTVRVEKERWANGSYFNCLQSLARGMWIEIGIRNSHDYDQ
jgi:hypothetical protein